MLKLKFLNKYSLIQIQGGMNQKLFKTMVRKKNRFLGIIQVFVAIGAIPAGLSMIFVPNGSKIGISTKILQHSPFNDFFIPGIFLFFANGILNLFAAVLSFRNNKYSSCLGLGLGIFLMAWICLQVYFIGIIHFLQPLYLIIGIIETALSYNIKSHN